MSLRNIIIPLLWSPLCLSRPLFGWKSISDLYAPLGAPRRNGIRKRPTFLFRQGIRLTKFRFLFSMVEGREYLILACLIIGPVFPLPLPAYCDRKPIRTEAGYLMGTHWASTRSSRRANCVLGAVRTILIVREPSICHDSLNILLARNDIFLSLFSLPSCLCCIPTPRATAKNKDDLYSSKYHYSKSEGEVSNFRWVE